MTKKATKATVDRTAPLVLLVDDFPDNRQMYAEFLAFSGLRVAEAENGHEAVQKANTLMPDLVVMDLSLPGMDGWEATRRLKADPRLARIPVVVLSAHAMRGDEERARATGCDDFITKPIDEDILFGTLERHLGL
jgi:two-component system, cell cycle response regulator DivK